MLSIWRYVTSGTYKKVGIQDASKTLFSFTSFHVDSKPSVVDVLVRSMGFEHIIQWLIIAMYIAMALGKALVMMSLHDCVFYYCVFFSMTCLKI